MALVLSGTGMVSSVGWGVIPSCAAIRAGISRPKRLKDVLIPDWEGLEPADVMGHPIPDCTQGFGPVGCWLRLAQACVTDLRQKAALPPPDNLRFWEATDWVCVLPHLEARRYLEVQQCGPQQVISTFLDRLPHLLGLPCRRERIRCIPAGHTGTALAIQQAEQSLLTRHAERVILLAVDSYLDETSLEWLLEKGRIKSPVNPVGLMPGEAGACLLLELASVTRSRRAPVLAVVEAVATEQVVPDRQGVESGAALARSILQALSVPPALDAFRGDIICDLNGEEWRARSWGHARVRLAGSLDERSRLLVPATCLGEIGAASGAVAACMAERSFARGYASADRTLVISYSEERMVSAIRLRTQRDGA